MYLVNKNTMNKKQRILEIIDTLSLPMSPEEVKVHLNSLDEREIDLLLPLYEEMMVFKNVVEIESQLSNPMLNSKMNDYEYKKTTSITKDFKKTEIEDDFEYQVNMISSEEKIDKKRKTLFQQFQDTALAIVRYLNGNKSDELIQTAN